MESCAASLSRFQQRPASESAAIVGNKRLGHALSIVKAQQDLKLATKVMTNSEKDGYKKRGRKIYGPDFESKTREPAAV